MSSAKTLTTPSESCAPASPARRAAPPSAPTRCRPATGARAVDEAELRAEHNDRADEPGDRPALRHGARGDREHAQRNRGAGKGSGSIRQSNSASPISKPRSNRSSSTPTNALCCSPRSSTSRRRRDARRASRRRRCGGGNWMRSFKIGGPAAPQSCRLRSLTVSSPFGIRITYPQL